MKKNVKSVDFLLNAHHQNGMARFSTDFCLNDSRDFVINDDSFRVLENGE